MRTLRIRVDFTVNGGDPFPHTSKGRLSLITAPIGNFWEPVVRRGLDSTQRKAQVVGPGSVTGLDQATAAKASAFSWSLMKTLR